MDTNRDLSDEDVTSGTISVAAAAKRLGIGRQTAYSLAREGRLPGALRLGRRIVVSRFVIEQFLAGKMPNIE